MHNLRHSWDNVRGKGDMQQTKLQRLEFHAILDKEIFYIYGLQIRWSCSTMDRSIYLSRQLKLRTGLITQMYIFHV